MIIIIITCYRFTNRGFILKAVTRSLIILLLSGFTEVSETPVRVRDRKERQREMAEGKEEWTGSGATLETNLRWPWSSRAVSAVERIQTGETPQRSARPPHTLCDWDRFYLLIRGTFIDICWFPPCGIIALHQIPLCIVGHRKSPRSVSRALFRWGFHK